MKACLILHNMIVEDEQSDQDDLKWAPSLETVQKLKQEGSFSFKYSLQEKVDGILKN